VYGLVAADRHVHADRLIAPTTVAGA